MSPSSFMIRKRGSIPTWTGTTRPAESSRNSGSLARNRSFANA